MLAGDSAVGRRRRSTSKADGPRVETGPRQNLKVRSRGWRDSHGRPWSHLAPCPTSTAARNTRETVGSVLRATRHLAQNEFDSATWRIQRAQPPLPLAAARRGENTQNIAWYSVSSKNSSGPTVEVYAAHLPRYRKRLPDQPACPVFVTSRE